MSGPLARESMGHRALGVKINKADGPSMPVFEIHAIFTKSSWYLLRRGKCEYGYYPGEGLLLSGQPVLWAGALGASPLVTAEPSLLIAGGKCNATLCWEPYFGFGLCLMCFW